MVVFWIIFWIIIVAFVVSIIAGVADFFGKKNSHKTKGVYERFIKRPLDAFCATGALIVLSPVLIITALLVRIKLGSPVLFSQKRPGRDEYIFKLFKFRTMTDARDEFGNLKPDTERLTPFGKWLRSTSLDELPELFNIVKGDMSLVGPRPLLVRYLCAYTDKERRRHEVRPGLSGLAQINGRNYVPWDERLAFDVEYVDNISFIGDFKIVLKTLLNVLKHDDVATNTEEIDEGYLDEIRGCTGR